MPAVTFARGPEGRGEDWLAVLLFSSRGFAFSSVGLQPAFARRLRPISQKDARPFQEAAPRIATVRNNTRKLEGARRGLPASTGTGPV